MPRRLNPTNPIAPDAILVGDPGRALMLAQELLVDPLMSNHARGLWGYSATSAEGRPLTIQSTGMGGPSAAIVLNDLVRLGVRRAIRVGSCEALGARFEPGDIVVAERAVGADGTSRALRHQASTAPAAGEPAVTSADSGLVAELAGSGPSVTVLSRDIGSSLAASFGSLPESEFAEAEHRDRPAVADLQTGALFTLGELLGVQIAAVLVVEGHADDEPMRKAGRAAMVAMPKARL